MMLMLQRRVALGRLPSGNSNYCGNGKEICQERSDDPSLGERNGRVRGQDSKAIGKLVGKG